MAVQRATTKASKARQAPYPAGSDAVAKAKKSDANSADASASEAEHDKENQSPTKGEQTQAKKKTTTKSKPSKEPDRSHLPENYLDIELEERKGEVPCHESASAIHRKLNALCEKKVKIPGSNKVFNKTNLATEMTHIAMHHHDVQAPQQHGPFSGSSARSIANFLKKTGTMGGGDLGPYYYGNMLLEKLRIWNGEKKTKAALKAEEEFPDGRQRIDPATVRVWCTKDNRPSRQDMTNLKR